MRTGDIDAIKNGLTKAVEVYYNDGTGAFTLDDSSALSGLMVTTPSACADLDGDGDMDCVMGNDFSGATTSAASKVHLVHNRGSGALVLESRGGLVTGSEVTTTDAVFLDVDGYA